MTRNDLCHLIADALRRTERAQRILEHHGHEGSAQAPQLGGCRSVHLGPHDGQGLRLDVRAAARKEAHESERRGALSRSGLTDERHGLATVELEGNATHGGCQPCPASEDDTEVDDVGDRHVGPSVVRLLREQQLARPAETSDGLLFPTRGGLAWDANNFMRRVFKPAAAAIDVPDLTFHDLRHTGASLMIAAGCNVKVIAEQMGHADGGALVLHRDGHLYSGAKRHAALALERHLFTDTTPERAVGTVWDGVQQAWISDGKALQTSSGADRVRTGDLLLAKQALFQLSYGPARHQGSGRRAAGAAGAQPLQP